MVRSACTGNRCFPITTEQVDSDWWRWHIGIESTSPCVLRRAFATRVETSAGKADESMDWGHSRQRHCCLLSRLRPWCPKQALHATVAPRTQALGPFVQTSKRALGQIVRSLVEYTRSARAATYGTAHPETRLRSTGRPKFPDLLHCSSGMYPMRITPHAGWVIVGVFYRDVGVMTRATNQNERLPI
jgi:hypothetical protein